MTTLFRERLTPGPVVIGLAIIFGLMMGVIMIPISFEIGLAVAIVMAIIFPVALIVSSPVVEVTHESVRAGRAHIEPEFLGEAKVLDKAGYAIVQGTGIRPQDFRLTRGWINTGVEVPVIDPSDPTPAWIISLRHADDFALALSAVHKDRTN